MITLVTGDWHLGISSHGVVLETGRNSRLSDLENVLHRIITYADGNGVQLFVCAGDIFHTNKPGQEEQLVFLGILEALADTNIPFIRFIIGNHDYSSKLGNPHALKLFKMMFERDPRFKIYDQTTWELIKSPTDDQSLLICFYPYKGDEPDWEEVYKHTDVHARAVVCHSHLEGAVVGAEPFEVSPDSATKFKHLPVDFVWAGHFHKPQILCDVPLAFYPGSVIPVDFNERNDVKGVVIVDTMTKKYECVGFDSRMLVQLDLKDRATLTDVEIASIKDAIVKVNVSLDELELSKYHENALRAQLAVAHSVAGINLDVRRQKLVRDESIKLGETMIDNFDQFVSNKNYGKLRELIVTKGREIIQQNSK